MSRIPARHWPGPPRRPRDAGDALPRGGDIVHLALHWHARGVRPEVDPETGDKKSIYVITADGRLAQLWDTDMWNLDFPADHF